MTLIGLMTADIAQSCPSFVSAATLPEWTLGSTPDHVRLFSLNDSKKWVPLPLQIDPMTDTGVFDATRSSRSKNVTIKANDRFVFYTDAFGKYLDAAVEFPCGASQLAEVRSKKNTFAYLANCLEPQKDTSIVEKPVVGLEAKERRIFSNSFEYIYHPRNQLLYEALNAKTVDGKIIRSAYDSDVSIRLDIKKFFTLHFDNTDIESYINSSKIGELGVIQDVAFYLRLFAFKIDLKMNTVASFFESGANIPMVVDVPADASKHLNPGSGSLYSLKLDQAEFIMDHPQNSMPQFAPDLLRTGSPDLIPAALRRCQGNQCAYKMMGRVDGRPFALTMTTSRSVVEMGFFPTFIKDAKEFKTVLGWSGARNTAANERAIFFATHGLAKGTYKIDSWILLGDASVTEASCPVPVDVSPVGPKGSGSGTAH